MIKTWLDKLCDPLENPQYPQGRSRLYILDENDNIIAKCAEGEIACQNGLKLGLERVTLHIEDFVVLKVPYDLISGIDIFYIEGDTCHGLSDLIYTLNDAHFTYPEIVEFLRTTFGDAV